MAMIKCFLNFTTILSLISFSILFLPSTMSISNDNNFHENDQEDYYVLDNPIPNFQSRSRFLANIIKKGTYCHSINVCNGVSANKGKSKLFCCKTTCRNVLGDDNNCGTCGRKCNLGERCCDGRCTVVLSSAHNCGTCGRECKAGVKCENGYCGYA